MKTAKNIKKPLTSSSDKHKQTESFVLVVSDAHIGKETPSYNIQTAKQIFLNLSDTLSRLYYLLSPHYTFDEFVLIMLGDMLDGSDIYPTQAHHQELTAVTAQAGVAAMLFLPLIERGLQIAPQVKVYGVAGNHGRSGKSAHEASNWDIVFYNQLELIATTKYGNRVKFDYNAPIVITPDAKVVYPEMFWLKQIKIKDHYFLLHHGHGTRSTYGVPYYGLLRRAAKWRSALDNRWRVLLVGHFHQFSWIEENDIIILLNGTPVFDDIWALETLGLRGVNKTWCFGVSHKYPITWQYAIQYHKGE